MYPHTITSLPCEPYLDGLYTANLPFNLYGILIDDHCFLFLSYMVHRTKIPTSVGLT